MISIEPERSSSSTRAYALPEDFAILRDRDVIIPPTVITAPSGRVFSSVSSEAIAVSVYWPRASSSPRKGWSET